MEVMTDVCGTTSLKFDERKCPICSKPGQRVKPETVKGLLNKDSISKLAEGYSAHNNKSSGESSRCLLNSLEGYSLCLTKDCDAVYFGQQIFYKSNVRKKVWFKENDPTVPVCYCKNVSEEDIIKHISVRGCCQSIKDIKEHTGANTGRDCLTENPAGT